MYRILILASCGVLWAGWAWVFLDLLRQLWAGSPHVPSRSEDAGPLRQDGHSHGT
jgi:hypothetical protein